jgi:hypothetical protein
MTDDALAPFIRAYRDENPGSALDTRAIRRGVLLGFQLRQRRRLFVVRFVLPIAATFFGSVALAASQGLLPRLEEVPRWLGISEDGTGKRTHGDEPVRARQGGRRPLPPPVARGVEEKPAPAPAPVVLTPATDPERRLEVDELPLQKPAQQKGSPPEATARASGGALSADLRAYREAHRLHFDGADAGRALAAWDTYLASHPAGTFAPEARFNRAVCLLRLGRRAEAKSVLVPIAESSSFAFGRERARALLDAMGE